MRNRLAVALILLPGLAGVITLAAPAAAPAPTPTPTPTPTSAPAPARLFTLSDPRLTELSGLAVGTVNPNLLYAQNDSGDTARFFALDARTGVVKAECRLADAHNVDWEDLAVGPDAAGTPSVWLADIGDNGRSRSPVTVYRIDEPRIIGDRCAPGRSQQWRLRYPDGPHDAESLLLDPVHHRLFVVTKELLGHSEVFEVPADPGSGVQPMTLIGSVRFQLTGTPGGPNPVGQLTATGAAMSSDGKLLAIRTYTDAYLWPVSGGDVAAAIRGRPTVVALPAQPQGEGIAVNGSRLLIDSENVGSAVYSIPIPQSLLARSTSEQPSAPRSTGSGPRPRPSATAPAGSKSGEQGRAFAVAMALMAILAVALGVGRRRRRR